MNDETKKQVFADAAHYLPLAEHVINTHTEKCKALGSPVQVTKADAKVMALVLYVSVRAHERKGGGQFSLPAVNIARAFDVDKERVRKCQEQLQSGLFNYLAVIDSKTSTYTLDASKVRQLAERESAKSDQKGLGF